MLPSKMAKGQRQNTKTQATQKATKANTRVTGSAGTNKKDDGSNGRITVIDTEDPLKGTAETSLVTTGGAQGATIKSPIVDEMLNMMRNSPTDVVGVTTATTKTAVVMVKSTGGAHDHLVQAIIQRKLALEPQKKTWANVLRGNCMAAKGLSLHFMVPTIKEGLLQKQGSDSQSLMRQTNNTINLLTTGVSNGPSVSQVVSVPGTAQLKANEKPNAMRYASRQKASQLQKRLLPMVKMHMI
ncbi:hypothetical protein HAX54_028429 [Datura stramonium]|uniref:Uncharacterized protein n=1 Tax=Datura stramonium TaxID=4076 RepID=A0ABS8V4J9_DATST|nr:hypothetical protein [Datura stramonium]